MSTLPDPREQLGVAPHVRAFAEPAAPFPKPTPLPTLHRARHHGDQGGGERGEEASRPGHGAAGSDGDGTGGWPWP